MKYSSEKAFLLELQSAADLEQQGQVEAAKARYATLLKQKPQHYLALSLLGALECRHGNITDGEALLRQSISSNPDHWAAYNNLGNVLLLKNRTDEARIEYRRSLELKNDAVDPLINLGSLAVHRREFNVAVDYLKRALAVSENNMKALRALANAYDQGGQLKAAVECY